jgi:adenine specific DNA methylase Mod
LKNKDKVRGEFVVIVEFVFFFGFVVAFGVMAFVFYKLLFLARQGKLRHEIIIGSFLWLCMMYPRLKLLRDLLTEDGAIYVQLDYNEVHYCKAMMDEIFGRENFQREIIWRIGWISGYKSADKNWVRNHDTILFYSKNAEKLKFKKNYIPYAADYFFNITLHKNGYYIIELLC